MPVSCATGCGQSFFGRNCRTLLTFAMGLECERTMKNLVHQVCQGTRYTVCWKNGVGGIFSCLLTLKWFKKSNKPWEVILSWNSIWLSFQRRHRRLTAHWDLMNYLF